MIHPRDGFEYPFVERLEVMDCGFKIAALIREKDGTLTALRWRLKDILDHAETGLTSNIK